MEIVVNDANVLIDLFNAGLLPYLKELGLDFRTLDVIINEIEDEEQQSAVQSIIDDGILSVYYCCPLKVSEQRDIHPQCCCNGIADDFSEGKPLS